jgi:hypothetical protein
MSGEHAGLTSHAWTRAVPSAGDAYGLVVRDTRLRTAFGLLIKSLPYAFVRFGILAIWSIGCILWVLAAFGGARAISAELAPALGPAWLIACLATAIWIWATALRRAMHLLACGHVAVLTALITRGQTGDDRGSMLGRGEDLLMRRFGEPAVLFGMTRLLRCNFRALHATFDWTDQVIYPPWLRTSRTLKRALQFALKGYQEKAILSYNLARNEDDPWAVMRDGFVYYAQNAERLLASSVRAALIEMVSTSLLALMLLAPVAVATFILPDAMQPQGSAIAVLTAILLAAALRSAFIKPLFLIMLIVRFHVLVEDQAIDRDWRERVASLPGTFGTLSPGFVMPREMRGFWPGTRR